MMTTSDRASRSEVSSENQSVSVPSPARKLNLQWLPRVAVLIALASLAAAAVIAFNAAQHAKHANHSAPAPVLTVAVQPASFHSIEREISVNGSVSAWDPISVGTEANGFKIITILVDEGAKVTRGQVLATLDSSVIRPQLESEEARLKASVANAQKAVQPNRPEDINGLQAALMQARANVADQEAALVQATANQFNAKQNVDRYILLCREGAVSKQELENRETNAVVCDATVRSAEERVTAAKFALKQSQERLSMATVGGRAEDIRVADANVDEIRANVKRLKAQVEQTIVRAPVDGLVTRRDVHIGDISTAGKTMFLMSRDNRLELRAMVPETDLGVVKPGETVSITSALTGDKKIKGSVREISPLVDADTRLATVRIDIPSDSGVKPGTYAEGRIHVGKYEALTVPAESLISENDKPVVFVLRGNQVESRPVVVGARLSDQVEITKGLQPGEAFVVTGSGFLKDSDYVSVSK